MNIRVEKQAMVQTVRTGRIREIWTITYHDTEAVGRFKYLRTVINKTNEETEEIKATILAANKAYSSPQTILRPTQIHRKYKIKLHKTLIKPVLCYEIVTWILTQMTEQTLCTFERKFLINYGPIQDNGRPAS
jgi:hypothetical protein